MYPGTNNNVKELPIPIITVEVNDAEMEDLKVLYLINLDKKPYVVCNVQDIDNKTYYQWTGSEWINWVNSRTDAETCIGANATLTPLTITSNQNNYAPPGLTNLSGEYIKTFLRISASLPVDITGLIKPNQSCNIIVHILNIGTTDINFKNNNGSSLAENRFLFPGGPMGGQIKIKENEMASFIYDSNLSRWFNLAKN